MQVLRDIWANLYARIGLLVLLAIIMFALIFRVRMPIYNFFLRTFSGMVYDDISTWDGERFQADEELATMLYTNGLEEFAELAIDTYELPGTDTLREALSLQGYYYEHLTPEAATAIGNFTQDLQLFCPALTAEPGASTHWEMQERMKDRRLKYDPKGTNRPFDYAIGDEDFPKIRERLLTIDMNYFYAALQYYPAAPAAIRIRSLLYTSICRPPSSAQDWQRSLDFLEYRQETKLLQDYAEKKLTPTSEEISRKLFLELQKDEKYRETLRHFMRRMTVQSGDLSYMANKHLEAYRLHSDVRYLQQYLEIQLRLVRTLSQGEAARRFVELYALEDPGLSRDPEYVYLLAETSWRAGETDKALAIVKNILRDGIYRDTSDFRRLLRLQFILETP